MQLPGSTHHEQQSRYASSSKGLTGGFSSTVPLSNRATDTTTTPGREVSATSPQHSAQSPGSPSPHVVPIGQEEDDAKEFVNEFGFVLRGEDDIRAEKEYTQTVDGVRIARREGKWKEMTADWDRTNEKRFAKMKERVRKGVPLSIRGMVWQLLVGSKAEMVQNPGVFRALLTKPITEDTDGYITRDLHRTFPTHTMFREQGGEGQRLLRNVLHAYATIDPEVGYVQGMGFVCGTLLTQMSEEEAFWCFHCMMHGMVFRMREMYLPGFPLIQMFFFQLKALMRKHLPKLARHFEEQGIEASFFASQWFLTLFVYHFDFRALLRIWDIFLCEGWKIVFRVALALLQWEEKILLAMGMDKLLPHLKNLHEGKNPDLILTKALKFKLKTQELLDLRKQYEEQTKVTL